MNEVFALYHLKEMHDHLRHDLEHLAELRTECTHITQTLSDMPGSPNRNLFKMDNQMARLLDYEAQVKKKVETYKQAQAEVINYIKALPDAKSQKILILRYVQFKSNTEISAYIHKQKRQTEYLISKAIKQFTDYY